MTKLPRSAIISLGADSAPSGHGHAAEKSHRGNTAGMHQIGEVAEQVGLSLRTVRYYEEMGLVVPSGRTQGGFRLYTEADIERLALIKQMKPLGFSLEEMRELLEIHDRLGESGLEQHTAAVERLAVYAAAAAEQCGRLRVQLEIAQGFARTLQRAVERHCGPDTSSR